MDASVSFGERDIFRALYKCSFALSAASSPGESRILHYYRKDIRRET